MVTQNAQELHLTVGQLPMVRNSGEIFTLGGESVLVEKTVTGVVKETLTDIEWNTLNEKKEIHTVKEISSLGRFKVVAYFQRGVISITFHLIPKNIPSIADISIPEHVQGLINKTSGLLIVSGPIDSGKSTVSATLLQQIIKTRPVRVMTIEDPLEYLLTNGKGSAEQRQIGRDVESFEQGIELLAKEDVEVVFVSNITGEDVARGILNLALSDRLVIVTINSDSSVRAVERFIDIANAHKNAQILNDLSDALLATINLRLVARQSRVGRVLAYEVMLSSRELAFALREEDYPRMQNVIHTSRQSGMITLDQSLVDLAKNGIITKDVAMATAHDPERIEGLLKK